MYRRQTGGRMSGSGSPATYATNAAVFQSRNEVMEQDGVVRLTRRTFPSRLWQPC
jgi:hypothetical protein